jgi:hypothetical protein
VKTEIVLVDPRTKQAFLSARRRTLEKFDYLPHIKVGYCFQADQEHAKSGRQYAHWGHRKNVVCVAHAIDELPDANKRGIFLHEFGHALDDYFEPESEKEERIAAALDDIEDDEDRADEIVSRLIGAKIDYDENNVQKEAE